MCSKAAPCGRSVWLRAAGPSGPATYATLTPPGRLRHACRPAQSCCRARPQAPGSGGPRPGGREALPTIPHAYTRAESHLHVEVLDVASVQRCRGRLLDVPRPRAQVPDAAGVAGELGHAEPQTPERDVAEGEARLADEDDPGLRHAPHVLQRHVVQRADGRLVGLAPQPRDHDRLRRTPPVPRVPVRRQHDVAHGDRAHVAPVAQLHADRAMRRPDLHASTNARNRCGTGRPGHMHAVAGPL